jgi:hypothetical protein
MRFSLNCWNIRQQVKVYGHPVDNLPFHTLERPDVALASKSILGSFVSEQPFTCESITVHNNFRNEILRDWVNDMLVSDRLAQFRQTEGRLEYDAIDQIIRAHAARYNLPYVSHNSEMQ